MNILVKKYTLYTFLVIGLGDAVSLYAKQPDSQPDSQNVVEQALPQDNVPDVKNNKTSASVSHKDAKKKETKKNNDEEIVIHYEDKDLTHIINFFATQMGVNIILPQGGNIIKEKITIHLEQKMAINEAWDRLLPMILDMAGYTMVPKEDSYVVARNGTNKEIAREPLPIYIGVAPSNLPATDQRIRYMYYLTNLQVTESSKPELDTVIKGLMPNDVVYMLDGLAQAILFVAKSNDIKSIMEIIVQLDQVSEREKLDIIGLNHTDAHVVAGLFDKILTDQTEPHRYKQDIRKRPEATYFSQNIRLIPEPRTNSLILMGRTQAVDRVRNFIENYVDVEVSGGKSVLHTYKLQYLDATDFAVVLQNIVSSNKTGSTGQSRGSMGVGGGTERFFEDVLIFSDTPTNAKAGYFGSNRLVVAARNDDWIVIEKLIEELDTPQPQVLIEVLIADLTIDDQRTLGSILRNPAKIPLPADINFQSAQAAPVVVQTLQNPLTIQADLLTNQILPPGSSTPTTLLAPAQQFDIGSTLISLNDANGSTWSLLQLLKKFTSAKILSHPHVIATHNQKATVTVGQTRLIPGNGTATNSAATTKFDSVKGNLVVEITPRISSGNTINLQININIDEFLSPNPQDNTRAMRNVVTNANMLDNSILAIGGLIRTADTDGISSTPILGKIPILGWFFKNRNREIIDTNLTVFISIKKILPRLREGIGTYTHDYINVTKKYASEGNLFDSLKDPINHWFFKTDTDAMIAADTFIATDEKKMHARKKVKTAHPYGYITQASSISSTALVTPNEVAIPTEPLIRASAPAAEPTRPAQQGKSRRRRRDKLNNVIKPEDENPFKKRSKKAKKYYEEVPAQL